MRRLRKLPLARRSGPIRAVTVCTTYGGDGKIYRAVTTVGKEFDPSTHAGQFRLAALRGPCPTEGSPMPRTGFRPLGNRFTITGSGILGLPKHPVILTSLRKARSVALARRGSGGVVVEACAPVRFITLVR